MYSKFFNSPLYPNAALPGQFQGDLRSKPGCKSPATTGSTTFISMFYFDPVIGINLALDGFKRKSNRYKILFYKHPAQTSVHKAGLWYISSDDKDPCAIINFIE